MIQRLSTPRYGHRSIVHENKIYHIGGNEDSTGYMPFEEWEYNESSDNFKVTVSNTLLDDYFIYPETFIVNAADYENCI